MKDTKSRSKKEKPVKKKKIIEEEKEDKKEDEGVVDFTIGNEPYEEEWDLDYDYYDSDYGEDYSS